MIGQPAFALRGRNPDVLTCIANLSNDEVFTPPEFANRMLDTLAEAWARDHGGAILWADPSVRFMDSCAKSDRSYPSGYPDRMGFDGTHWAASRRTGFRHDLLPKQRSRQAPRAGAGPIRAWCCARRG